MKRINYTYKTVERTGTMYYIHQDRLGNYDVLTNDTGVVIVHPTKGVVGRLAYDVWGNRVLWNDWTQRIGYDSEDTTHIFRRGFTQHEHLESHGTINMNGRMYDPNTASFFSPDPFVQAPFNTQSFNRYSYCLNNPLMYTDPSGEIFIPALMAGFWSWSFNGAHTAPNYGVENFVSGFATTALSAGFASGIGSIFGKTGSVWNEIGRAGAHALSNGTISAVSGGDFWQGFASGGLSSLAGSTFDAWGKPFSQSALGMYAFSGAAGGVGSWATGGNFWEGAAKGLIVAGFNHLRHQAEKFNSKIEGYKALWEASLDENGNFVRETAGWELKNGKLLLLPNDKNTATEAKIDALPTYKKGGKPYVRFNGKSYEISTSIHTHKSADFIKYGLSLGDRAMIQGLNRPINIMTPSSIYNVNYNFTNNRLIILNTIPR